MSFRPSRYHGQAPKLKPSLVSDSEPMFKGAKTSNGVTRAFPAVNRPMKDALKPKTTISVAGIFNRKPMKEIYPPRSARARRPRTPEHQLFTNYKSNQHLSGFLVLDQIDHFANTYVKVDMDASRQSIADTTSDALDSVNAELTASLDSIKLRDTSFLKELEEQQDIILKPLTEDFIEADFTTREETERRTANMGKRYAKLKEDVKEKGAELAKLWAEWDAVQQEIIDLGVEVLGIKAIEDVIGIGKVKNRRNLSYVKKSEALNLDFEKHIAEVKVDTEAAGFEAVQTMETIEKEFEIELRKFKAELVQQIFDEDTE